MGVPNVGEKTLVVKVVDGCMCTGCFRKVRKRLLQIRGTFSIQLNADEKKLTIHGSNVDSNAVINELRIMNKKVQLESEDNSILDQIDIEEHDIEVDEDEASVVVDNPIIIEDKQIIEHEMEVHKDEAKPPNNSQVVVLLPSSFHEHELELKEYDKRFTCNGCKEEGFKTRYRCKHCNYELHKVCNKPKRIVSHDLFKGYDFIFFNEKPTCGSLCRVCTKSCAACGNEIHGYNYRCEAKDLYLHPMCVSLKGDICIQGESFVLKNKATSKCFWCNGSEKGTISGWSYVSKGDKGQLHVNCLAKIAHEAWKEKATGGGDDAYILVLQKRLNLALIKSTNKNKWSRGGKLLKMILMFARTIIGILLGDPTVILASMLVEVLKE